MDPYVYPGTETLINKFHLRDAHQLREVEGVIYGLQSLKPLPAGNFDHEHLKAIHKHFFDQLYEWAGTERTVSIAKGNSFFAAPDRIEPALNKLFTQLKSDEYLQNLPQQAFCNKLSYYFNEMNAAHAFREGNGRTQRAFCKHLAENAGYQLSWKAIPEQEYLNASILGFLEADYESLALLLEKAVTPAQKQEIEINEIPELTTASIEKLRNYIKKQVGLTQLIQQKYTSQPKDPYLAKILSEEALLVGKETRELAEELIQRDDIQAFLKKQAVKPYLIPLSKQGGFSEIHQRFQKNQIQTQDILAVLRFARSHASRLSQATLPHTLSHSSKV